MRILRPLLVGVVAAVILAGCGDKTVGQQLFNGFKDRTPTPAPATAAATAKPVAVTVHTPTPVVHTAAPTAPPRPTPTPIHFPIAIQGDNSNNPAFNPPVVRVYVGSLVVFTNTDTVPRSVVADNGAFNSGLIAPGKSWSYTTTTAGNFDYHDGTRPYAVASLQVLAK